MITPNAGRLNPKPSPSIGDSSSLWEDAPTTLTRRCVMMEVMGETDSGRTTLALTAPGPIAYIHSFEKWEGRIQETIKRTQVRMRSFRDSYQGTPDQVQVEATRDVSQVEKAVLDAYTWARTIIIDSHTALWVTYQLAELGSMVREDRDAASNKKGQLIYTGINNKWQSMIKEFHIRADDPTRIHHTNLIVIGQMGERYKGGKATGQMESKGQKGVGTACDVRIRTFREMDSNSPLVGVVSPLAGTGSSLLSRPDPSEDINAGALESEFMAVVEKPWYNNDVRGMQFPNVICEELSFAGIMSVITDTAKGEWE